LKSPPWLPPKSCVAPQSFMRASMGEPVKKLTPMLDDEIPCRITYSSGKRTARASTHSLVDRCVSKFMSLMAKTMARMKMAAYSTRATVFKVEGRVS